MEVKNKKRRILYVTLGAALLLAIVGGTYAFFSASVSNSGTIGGNTQDIENRSLMLTVKKVVFTGTSAPSNDLVPAYFGLDNNDDLVVPDPSELEQVQVAEMLTNKCENDGFTGCHVYQIKISANQDITHVNLLLNLSVSNLTGTANVVNKSQWGYVVFSATGTVDSSTGATSGLTNPVLNTNNGAAAAIGNGVTNLDIHNDGSLTAGTTVTYYLLVYVNDTDESQNTSTNGTGDANYVVGTYSGTLELQALGGKVRACFTPTGSCDETQNSYLMNRVTSGQHEVCDEIDVNECWEEPYYQDNLLKSENTLINQSSIASVHLVDHINVPANAVDSWDVSAEQDGSVMAWVVQTTDSDKYCLAQVTGMTLDAGDPTINIGIQSQSYCASLNQSYGVEFNCGNSNDCTLFRTYDLYIGQVGGVKANPDSTYYFSYLENVTELDLTDLDMSDVTDMEAMFDQMFNLVEITAKEEDVTKICNALSTSAISAATVTVNGNSARECPTAGYEPFDPVTPPGPDPGSY